MHLTRCLGDGSHLRSDDPADAGDHLGHGEHDDNRDGDHRRAAQEVRPLRHCPGWHRAGRATVDEAELRPAGF